MTFTLLLSAVTMLVLSASCQQINNSNINTNSSPGGSILNVKGKNLESRFNPPSGYSRRPAAQNSYRYFLRHIPLKADGAPVHYYDGREKENNNIYAAVVDMEIGDKDLQQCADAVMRLRAEYLFSTGQKGAIHFNLTSGFRADYSKWMQGYRMSVKGSTVSWIKSAATDSSYKTFRNYLDAVYNYAGSLSLSKELVPVAWGDMQPGDVLIIGGSPGHAETVMDMAEGASGDKVFLLSQSYMPAQDIQILHNPDNANMSPWYELKAAPYTVHTPQYDFSTVNLMRWR